MNKLLETRNKAKAKKPIFERQDSNIKKQFIGQYRKPRGIHSKMRKGYRGHRVLPSIGYSSPRAVRGLTRNGLVPVVVKNAADIIKIKKGEGVILSSTLGLKKKLVVLEKAKELKLEIINVKNVEEFLTKSKERFENKKKEHKGKQEDRKKAKEEAEKKASEKKEEKNKTENKTQEKPKKQEGKINESKK